MLVLVLVSVFVFVLVLVLALVCVRAVRECTDKGVLFEEGGGEEQSHNDAPAPVRRQMNGAVT